jgi:hypothetical protein
MPCAYRPSAMSEPVEASQWIAAKVGGLELILPCFCGRLALGGLLRRWQVMASACPANPRLAGRAAWIVMSTSCCWPPSQSHATDVARPKRGVAAFVILPAQHGIVTVFVGTSHLLAHAPAPVCIAGRARVSFDEARPFRVDYSRNRLWLSLHRSNASDVVFGLYAKPVNLRVNPLCSCGQGA